MNKVYGSAKQALEGVLKDGHMIGVGEVMNSPFTAEHP